MCSTGGIGERVAAVAVAIAAFDELVLGGAVSDEELIDAVEAWQRVEQMAAARKLRVLAEIDRRRASAAVGAATAADVLVQRCGVAPGQAKAQAETAKLLEELPAAAGKLAAGELGVDQAQVLARKARELQAGANDRAEAQEAVAALDSFVADSDLSVSTRAQLSRRVDEWAHRRGHDLLAERERRVHAERFVQLVERDGGWDLRGRLDAVTGAHTKAMLDALARPHRSDDPRTWGQRTHDALGAVAQRFLEEGKLPTAINQRPHVLLLTTVEALHDVDGAPSSLLDGHGPVSNDLARQLCCDADVTAVLTDRSGEALDAKPLNRSPSRRQRAAVIARDRACVGCGAPVSRCEIHHIHWWSRGGRTEIRNLALVCWNCHTHLHHHDWRITCDATGRYRAGPPGSATGPPGDHEEPASKPDPGPVPEPHPEPHPELALLGAG